MPPVFAHGRLRLYLLKLLDEAPRHGYEVIRLLEERFQGLYAPSAGTVYPRLAKLEAEGLVTHATEGGRKVYSITEAGRTELAGRTGELADLELEIRESVSELAAEIREDVRGAAGKLRSDMRAAASASRHRPGSAGPGGARSDWESLIGDLGDLAKVGNLGDFTEKDAWRKAKEELRQAKQEWKEQARRAKDESRRAREDAQQARRQAKEADERAREQMRNAARQVQEHFARGDWPAGVRDGLAEITGHLAGLAKTGTWPPADRTEHTRAQGPEARSSDQEPSRPGGASTGTAASRTEAGPAPDWAGDVPVTGDPARDLDRLLDRFRDDIRDAARDRGVTDEQVAKARAHLATAASRVDALLRSAGPPDGDDPKDLRRA
ncbi:helix-turn-helix transcriptional regulator [Streptomyces sp. NBC_00247]|uniref:helix-turn-helix transcriptional regulator n=1 Tax=Streptomyces sp. NBC_00247 TaxID=2975689 RepID=UPI002E29AEB7|nr:helix-turn-helix transcriptional regulator [Streptomyces sp. NBC_00247]